MVRRSFVRCGRLAVLAFTVGFFVAFAAHAASAQCPHACGCVSANCERPIANPDHWNAPPAAMPFSWSALHALPCADTCPQCLVDCPESCESTGGCFSINGTIAQASDAQVEQPAKPLNQVEQIATWLKKRHSPVVVVAERKPSEKKNEQPHNELVDVAKPAPVLGLDINAVGSMNAKFPSIRCFGVPPKSEMTADDIQAIAGEFQNPLQETGIQFSFSAAPAASQSAQPALADAMLNIFGGVETARPSTNGKLATQAMPENESLIVTDYPGPRMIENDFQELEADLIAFEAALSAKHPPHGICPLPFDNIGATTPPDVAATILAGYTETIDPPAPLADPSSDPHHSHVILASDEQDDDCPGSTPRRAIILNGAQFPVANPVAQVSDFVQHGPYPVPQVIQNPYVAQAAACPQTPVTPAPAPLAFAPSTLSRGAVVTDLACRSCVAGQCSSAQCESRPCESTQCDALDAIVRRLERNAPGCINSPQPTTATTEVATATLSKTCCGEHCACADKCSCAMKTIAVAPKCCAGTCDTTASCQCGPTTNIASRACPYAGRMPAVVALPDAFFENQHAPLNWPPHASGSAFGPAPQFAMPPQYVQQFAPTPYGSAPSYAPPHVEAHPQFNSVPFDPYGSQPVMAQPVIVQELPANVFRTAGLSGQPKATAAAYQALQESVRQLETMAADLEEQKLYEQADRLRDTATELRAKSRAMSNELDAMPAETKPAVAAETPPKFGACPPKPADFATAVAALVNVETSSDLPIKYDWNIGVDESSSIPKADEDDHGIFAFFIGLGR